MQRLRTLAVAALLLGSTCSGGEDEADPGATVPTEVTTSTTVIDVSTIPAVIDEAYLNRVLEALDAVDGMATKIIVERKRFPPDAAALLHSIYDDEEFQDQVEIWAKTLASNPELSSFNPNPGNRRTIVQRIISRSSDCVWMAVSRDYSAAARDAPAARTEYIALRPTNHARDPKRLNPTAWIITFDGFNEDGSEPAGQCA
ncbi:MAG: hypothetical protein M3N68_08225 [Actinomycetota bacterium]|nr:hypothetical protein [Actinomycetota bacterium]